MSKKWGRLLPQTTQERNREQEYTARVARMEERRRVVVGVAPSKTRNPTVVARGVAGSKAKVDMSAFTDRGGGGGTAGGRDSVNNVNIRATALSPVQHASATTSYGSSTAQSRSRSPDRISQQNNNHFRSTPPVASTSHSTPLTRVGSATGTRGAKVVLGSGAKVVGSVSTAVGGSATRSSTFPVNPYAAAAISTPSRVYPETPFNPISHSPGPSTTGSGTGRARTTTAGGGMISLLSSPDIRSPSSSVFPSNPSKSSTRSNTGPTSPPLSGSSFGGTPLVKSNSLNRNTTPSSAHRPPLNRPITSPIIKSTPSPYATTTPRLPPPAASTTGSHGRSRSVASIFSTSGSSRGHSASGSQQSTSQHDSVSRTSNNDNFRRDSTFGDEEANRSGESQALSEVGDESTEREIELEIEREKDKVVVEARRIAEEREEKDARVRRKVLDLEITNKSLLSINSSLELTRVKQTSELRDLRRRLRESRIHLPISTLSMSTSDREFPEEGRRPPSDDYSDDDDSEEEEERELTWEEILGEDPTFAAATRTLMTLIKKGKMAILDKDVEIPPEGVGFGRVLHSSEIVATAEEVEEEGVEVGLGVVEEDVDEMGGSADQSFNLDDELGNVTFLADTLAHAAAHQSSFLAPVDPSSFYPSPLLSSSTTSSGSSASDSTLPSVQTSSPHRTPYVVDSSPRLEGLGVENGFGKRAGVNNYRREANMLGL